MLNACSKRFAAGRGGHPKQARRRRHSPCVHNHPQTSATSQPCRDGAGVRPALAWRWMQQRRSVAQQGARRTWPMKRRLPRRRPWRNGSARSQHGASRVRIRHKVHLACRSTRKGRCSTCTGGVSSCQPLRDVTSRQMPYHAFIIYGLGAATGEPQQQQHIHDKVVRTPTP